MAMENPNMSGAYNAAAPQHVTHNGFIMTMARVMNRPVFLPPVPSWLIRMLMGEMSDVVLKGSRISCSKIISAGYSFRYENLEDALRNVITG